MNIELLEAFSRRRTLRYIDFGGSPAYSTTRMLIQRGFEPRTYLN